MSDAPNFAVDLTNCDREPIHVLGTIQPFGFLIAVSVDWLVARVSANIGDFLGVTPEALLGKPIGGIIEDEALHAIRNRMTMLRGPDSVERLFGVKLTGDGRLFDVAVHFSGRSV